MRNVFLCAAIGLMLLSCGRRAPAPQPSEPPAEVDLSAPSAVYPAFADADPHDWDRRRPEHYAVHGLDVSRWQGQVDWRQARAAGISFVFIKATEGGDVADSMFQSHSQAAQSAGVPWGAYHYFYFCRPASEQARWFIRNVPRGADLPHVLDMEWTPHSKTCTLRPDAKTVRAEAQRFLDILERHYGRRPIVYTTVDFYADTGIGRLPKTEFWLRSVAGHPRNVYPRAVWRFWQYTGTGLVPGVQGRVDINVFNGSPDAWARWKAGGP